MSKVNISFRCFAFQEEDGTYTGVCLDLDIVEENHATLSEAVLSITDAINSHIKAAAKLNYPKELINRPAPKEYWDKLKEIALEKQPKKSPPPFQVFNTPSTASDFRYA